MLPIYEVFDICYDYDIWPSFLGCVKKKLPLSLFLDEIDKQEGTYPENYVKLRCLENHDQERIAHHCPDKEAVRNWTALSFMLKGTAFLYAGQEAMLSHRPSIFEKDTLDFSQGEDISGLITRLAQIKKTYLTEDGIYRLFAEDEQETAVSICEMGEKSVLGIFTLGSYRGSVEAYLQDGDYENQIDNSNVTVKDGRIMHDGKPVIVAVGTERLRKPKRMF